MLRKHAHQETVVLIELRLVSIILKMVVRSRAGYDNSWIDYIYE